MSSAFYLALLLIVSTIHTAASEDELVFRIGASVGKDGPCEQLYDQTAAGYNYFYSWLASQAPRNVTDAAKRTWRLRFAFRLVSHDCTEAGREAALSVLINGTATEPPVHLLLGGNGINAQEDALQADAASRVLLHCCTARDSVYTMDLPHVYGLFTPASRYTEAVLRTMAFSNIRRVAIAMVSDNMLHRQLCGGALKELPGLAELRPGFLGEAVALVNYTEAEAEAGGPGFWDRAAAQIAAAAPDALLVCDEMARASQLTNRLTGQQDVRLAALWMASYGNSSDFVTQLDNGGEYALTTVQWAPNLPYADSLFGTARDYAEKFQSATGTAPSYFAAAATAAGYVLMTALSRTIAMCDVSTANGTSNATWAGSSSDLADMFLWREGALLCRDPTRPSASTLRRVLNGQTLLRYSLNTLQMDTFFGPVGFNSFRQNYIHPAVVAQVLDGQLRGVIPLDVAEARLVLPIPPPPAAPPPAWPTTPAGITIITLACCLAGLLCCVAAVVLRHWLRDPRPTLATAVAIDPSEIQVDVQPLRKLDGTYEAGEGTYRGARVKLVVAVELMPGPAHPPRLPPVAGSTAAATVPSTVASPTCANMANGGSGGGMVPYYASSTGMLPYSSVNGQAIGSISATGYVQQPAVLAAAHAASSAGGSSNAPSPLPTGAGGVVTAGAGRAAAAGGAGAAAPAGPPLRPPTPLANRVSGLGMVLGAPQASSPRSGNRAHLFSSAVAAAVAAAAAASSIGGGSTRTLTRQLSEMELSAASGDEQLPAAGSMAAAAQPADEGVAAAVGACNQLPSERSMPIGIPAAGLPSRTMTAPLPATSPNPSPVLRVEDAADSLLPTSPFGRLPPGSGGLAGILTGVSPRAHGASNTTLPASIPDSAMAAGAATGRSSNNGFGQLLGKKPSGHLENMLQPQASFFDLGRVSNRAFGLSGTAAAAGVGGGGGTGSITGGGGWMVTRKLRKHVSSLLWRAFRLQHPAMCPILGIVWEWPLSGPGMDGAAGTGGGGLSRIPETPVSKGLTSPFKTANGPGLAGPGSMGGSGGGAGTGGNSSLTVPVIVRQWYELGDLSLLLENSTVPLPLLTKANIVRGVAEAVTYLHAQEPPIVVGPLHASRVLLDRNFNPHLFLRLSSLDPTYGSQAHQQRLLQAHQQQVQVHEAAQANNSQQQQQQRQHQHQQPLSLHLSQAHSTLAAVHAASGSGNGNSTKRTLMGMKLAAVASGFKRVTAGTEDTLMSSASHLPQPPTPVVQTEGAQLNQQLLMPHQQQRQTTPRSFAFDLAAAATTVVAATASPGPVSAALPAAPVPSAASTTPLVAAGEAAAVAAPVTPAGLPRDSGIMLTSAAAASEAGLLPIDSSDVHLTMPSIMAPMPSCPQPHLVVVDAADSRTVTAAGVAEGITGTGTAGPSSAGALASAPAGMALGPGATGGGVSQPLGLSSILAGMSGRLMLPGRVAPAAAVGGDSTCTHTAVQTPMPHGAMAAAVPPPPLPPPPPPYIPSCAQDVFEFGQLLCRIFVVQNDTPDTSRDQLMRISAAFDRESASDIAGPTGLVGSGAALPLAMGSSGAVGRSKSGAGAGARAVPPRSPFAPSGRTSPAMLPTENSSQQQQQQQELQQQQQQQQVLQQLLPVIGSPSIGGGGDNHNLSRTSSGLSHMGLRDTLQLANASRSGAAAAATAAATVTASSFRMQQQVTQAISTESPESVDEVLEALYDVCPELSELARSCMHPDPAQRPTFPEVLFAFENMVRPALLSGTMGASALVGLGANDMPGCWGADEEAAGGAGSPVAQLRHTHHTHASSATRSMAQALGFGASEVGAGGGGGSGEACGDSSVSGRTTNDGGFGGSFPRSSHRRDSSSNHHNSTVGAGPGGVAGAGGAGHTRPSPFFSNISNAFQSVAKGTSKPAPPPAAAAATGGAAGGGGGGGSGGAASGAAASAPMAPSAFASGSIMAAARQHLRHRGSQRAASNPAHGALQGNQALPAMPPSAAPTGPAPLPASAAAALAGSLLAVRRSGSFTQHPLRPVPTRMGGPGELGVARMGHLAAADDFLFDFFPPKVARALLMGETPQPERFELVSIYFSDVVGYTDLCSQLQPHEVMDLMHRLYSQLDAIIQAMALFKVETVGDAYLAVSNLRLPQPDSHARLLAQFAFEAVRAAASTPIHPERPELGCVTIRVGLHCGPVVGSVVGMLNRRYCLFGDSVNTAARMEHNSEPNRVHCSGAFAGLVMEQWPGARLISRGVRNIKGKGPMETFWIEEPRPSSQGQQQEDSSDAAQQALPLAKQQLPPPPVMVAGRTGRSSIHLPRAGMGKGMPRSRSNQELANMGQQQQQQQQEQQQTPATEAGAGGGSGSLRITGGGTGSASGEATLACTSGPNARPNSGGRGISLVASLRKSREWRRGSVDRGSRGFAFPASKP